MDKKLARMLIDSSLNHAESMGKVGSRADEFYTALENLYKEAEGLGVDSSYFRDRALAVEEAVITRQINYYEQKINECQSRKDEIGVKAYNALRNRQQSFLQTLKSTGKTAVELGKEEMAKRMFLAIDADTLVKDSAAVYAMLVTIPYDDQG